MHECSMRRDRAHTSMPGGAGWGGGKITTVSRFFSCARLPHERDMPAASKDSLAHSRVGARLEEAVTKNQGM